MYQEKQEIYLNIVLDFHKGSYHFCFSPFEHISSKAYNTGQLIIIVEEETLKPGSSCRSKIPAVYEVETKGFEFKACLVTENQLDKLVRPCHKIPSKRVRGCSSLIECLPRMYKVPRMWSVGIGFRTLQSTSANGCHLIRNKTALTFPTLTHV